MGLRLHAIEADGRRLFAAGDVARALAVSRTELLRALRRCKKRPPPAAVALLPGGHELGLEAEAALIGPSET
jgi:hypothetical protein